MGLGRKMLARYLVMPNPDLSIARHTALGAPDIHDAIKNNLVNKLSRPGSGGNYRLRKNSNRLEAMTDFALKTSAFNEILHLAGGTASVAVTLMSGFMGGGYEYTVWGSVLVSVNFPLVSLQRYLRAKMIKAVNRGLSGGEMYSADYRNWAGIDGRLIKP